MVAVAARVFERSLPTIWALSDELWERIEPILLRRYPPAPTGRPRADLRRVLDGVIYRLRSGVQWNQLPREFGDDSTVHRWFQRFVEDGVLEEIWAALAAECEALGDLDWEWQAVDGNDGQGAHGRRKKGPNPTDRAKPGTKKSLHIERRGGPLGIEIEDANLHDTKLLTATLEATVIERPDPGQLTQHLCLDKAYDNPTGEAACAAAGYHPAHPPHRRRETRHVGLQDPPRPPLGRRTHTRLALEVPRDPRPLRQEAAKLQGPHPARLRAPLGPSTPRPQLGQGRFEIVTKCSRP